MSRMAAIICCSIFAGCAALKPYASTPIASWQGKRPVEATVDCVIKALDYNFGPTRLFPGTTHGAKVIDEGRVYEIAPKTVLGPSEALYFVRVRSDGPQRTIIELYIPPIKYEAPLRDALAKCV